MKLRHQPTGFAVVCDRQGIIKRAFTQDSALASLLLPETHLSVLALPEEAAKVAAFLQTLEAQAFTAGWEFTIPVQQRLRAMRFSGLMLPEEIIISAEESVSGPDEVWVLDEMTSMNNELANLQRQLAMKNAELDQKNRDLAQAFANVKQLSGLLPICCCCKKIRGDKDYWHSVEEYISHHTDVRFSHGYCPECFVKAMKEVDELAETSGPSETDLAR